MATRNPILLAAGILLLGCNDDEALTSADESVTMTDDALVGDQPVGAMRRTTAPLNLRAAAGTEFAVLVTMPPGALVTLRMATPSRGFYAVTYGELEGWAFGQYLRVTAPPAATAMEMPVRISGPPVREHVHAFANASCSSVGGCRYTVGTYNGHQPTADRAIDIAASPIGTFPTPEGVAIGSRLADYGVANAASHKVDYVIWRQRINVLDGRGWRGMPDRGSLTQNHFDHVHVSFHP